MLLRAGKKTHTANMKPVVRVSGWVYCLQVYCQQHTAYSPHGPLVGCDLESKCICSLDWASLNPATKVVPAALQEDLSQP